METSQREKDYIKVKNTLEVLGFKGYLGTDSVDLMKSVLTDLIKATKAFKSIQLEKDRLSEELKVQGDLVLPLRNENYKLLQDNNSLHQEIINIKDKLDFDDTVTYMALKKSEETNEHLKLLINQKNAKIKSLENQNEQLQEKLSNMFDKIYMKTDDNMLLFDKTNKSNLKKGYIATPLTSVNISKTGEFILSDKLNNSQDSNSKSELNPNNNMVNNQLIIDCFRNEIQNYNNDKAEWVEQFKKYDEETNKLRQQIENLNNQILVKDKQLSDTMKNITIRNDEIQRLQKNVYLGDDNKQEIKTRYQIDMVNEMNEKLTRQNDFLNQENHRLSSIEWFHTHRCREEEIRKLENQIYKLSNSNKKLKKQLEEQKDKKIKIVS